MCCANEPDACEEEYSSQGKIDQDLFYVAGPRSSVHEVNCAKDQPGNSKECEYYADDSFFHNVAFGEGMQRICLRIDTTLPAACDNRISDGWCARLS